MISPSPYVRRLYTVRPLAFITMMLWAGAVGSAWLEMAVPSMLLAVAAVTLTLLTLERGRTLAEMQHASMSRALRAADARNSELERLGHLGQTLLSGSSLADLQHEVAAAAADLLQAESGGVSIMVEEGRFLKIVAATGTLTETQGMILPVDQSLLGWVVSHDEPALVENVDEDPRSYSDVALGTALRTAAVVPLRAMGVVLGTLAVYNRRDGGSFSDHDLQLLELLGDQVVVALDRAAGLESSRQNEAALALKNRELLRATKLKSDFLANMSHELRTPLNAINGFSDLMLTEQVGPLNEVQRDFLESVLRNGKHLLGLISSVLDLSKIEAGRMTLALEQVDMRAAIEGAIADTASLRSDRRQSCRVEVPADMDLAIVADPVRVRQVMLNLLSNASKFTPEAGEISIQCVRTRAPLPSPSDRAGDAGKFLSREAVWISVIDNGIGIAPADHEKLFQEFSQVETAHNRQQQGTGLGLALCRSFVEMHGGTIGVDSIPGRGSSFWFLLPVEGPIRRAAVEF